MSIQPESSGIKERLGQRPLFFSVCRFVYRWIMPIPVLLFITLPLVIAGAGFRILIAPVFRSLNSRKRKVLMVVPSYDRIGGYENQARCLAAYLASQGDPVVVVTDKGQGDVSHFNQKGFDVIRIGHLPPYPRHVLSRFNRILCLFLQHRSYRLVHIHAIFSQMSAAAVLAARLTGKKVITKIATEGDILECKNHPEFEFRSYFHTTRLMNRIVALSRRIRAECIRQGLGEARIEIIPNGVDTRRYAPVAAAERKRIRSELDLPGGKIALFVGRFVKRKGLDFLLENWKEISSKTGAALILAGDGPERSSLEEICRNKGIAPSVRFAGMVDHVPQLLKASDLFIFPSRREGVPNAVLEAMATALPVISTRIGGIEDIIETGTNGILIEPDSAEELIKAASALLEDRELSLTLGTRAREFILKNCSVDVIGKRYQSLYDALQKRG